ncbi:MAG: bile acid:sodium symporter family protein [Sphaerochaeta sp.]
MKPSVPYLFAIITFIGGLGISSNAFFGVIKKPKAILFFILGANIIMPLVAWALANLLFPNHPNIITGFVLLMSIPTALTGYIWSGIYQGNSALSLSFILISTILSPIVTPYTIKLLANSTIKIDTYNMMISLILIVAIPSLSGVAINTTTKGRVNDHLIPVLKPFSKIALFFIILITTAQISDRLLQTLSWAYIPIAIVSALITIAGYPISDGLGKMLHLEMENRKSITFAVSLRNISTALILAVTYFPPETALPVIFGIVFQQTVCAFMAYTLYGRKKIT